MAFDDQPLERTRHPTGPAQPPPSSPTRWIIVVAAVIVAASALALWWIIREKQETVAPMPTAATDVAVGSHRPKPQIAQLPSLETSDPFVRDIVHSLSQHPMLTRLLTTKDLIRTTVLAVQEIDDGKTPADPLRALQPATHATMVGADSGHVDPASYARWDEATGALISIRPGDAAQLYVNVKLLLDQAYRDLGHPNADFDEAVTLAIRTLAATPDVPGDEEVTRHGTLLEPVDPTIHAALPVQRQFLLVGPDNRAKILLWLKSLAAALELKID